MKLSSLSLFFIGLFLIACNHPSVETDWEKRNLKGKVKSIKVLSDPPPSQSDTLLLEQLTVSSFIENDSLLFNQSGQLIERYEFDTNYTISKKVFFDYNSDGRPSQVNCKTLTDQLIYKEIYTYDEEANSCLYTKTFANDSISEKEITYYDEEGREAVKLFYTPDDSIYQERKTSYDRRGNLNEVTDINYGENGFYTSTSYTFNYDDQVATEILFVDGELKRKVEYYYNDDKKLKGRYHFRGRDLTSSRLYERDQMDNITKETYIYEAIPLETVTLRQYTYDEHDNWIKKVVLSNDTTEAIINREILYFD